MYHTNLSKKYEYFSGNICNINAIKNNLFYTINSKKHTPLVGYLHPYSNILHFIKYLNMGLMLITNKTICLFRKIYNMFI